MKNFLFPYHSYRTKAAGVTMTTLSTALLILEKMTHFKNNNLNSQQIIHILSLLIIVGLFIMIFSKEKIDDEKVKIIRANALQIGFVILMTNLISLIVVSIASPPLQINGQSLSLIALMGLITYIFPFNIGLYIEYKESHFDEISYYQIRKNEMFFIAYILCLTALITVLIFV